MRFRMTRVLVIAVFVLAVTAMLVQLLVSCAQVPEEDMHYFARDKDYYNRPTWNEVYSLDDPINGNTCYFWNDLMSCVPGN